jgi:hypothetical protein
MLDIVLSLVPEFIRDVFPNLPWLPPLLGYVGLAVLAILVVMRLPVLFIIIKVMLLAVRRPAIFSALFGQRRMSLVDLRSLTYATGYNLREESGDVLWLFLYTLRQSARDDTVKLWGRPYTGLHGSEVLDPILPLHWQDFKISGIEFIGSDDNANVISYSLKRQNWREGSFTDLHIDRFGALKWLTGEWRAAWREYRRQGAIPSAAQA